MKVLFALALAAVLLVPVRAQDVAPAARPFDDWLRDLPKLRQNVELLIPPRYRATVHEVFDRVAAVGSNFIRGQLTVCAAMALLDSVGFLALGVPMAIFLGCCAGFGIAAQSSCKPNAPGCVASGAK